MRFLLVLSDAFDALRAYRGRVALALTGVAILGVLIAVYLPMIGGQRPSPQADVPRNISAQGPVEPARVAAASTPTPAAAPVAPPAAAPAPDVAPSPGPDLTPPPAPPPAPAPAPAPTATPAPSPAPSPAPAAAAPPAAATAGSTQVFRVQVGAFRDMARARGLSQRLTRAGFPTWVIPGTTPDGKAIYRVRTKQALPKAEARQLVARLRHRVPALRPFIVPSGTTG